MPHPAGVGKRQHQRLHHEPDQGFLCEYTETFAREHLARGALPGVRRPARAVQLRHRAPGRPSDYYLPRLRDDFVLLTPIDMLTRDETWINYGDMISKFRQLPDAVPNDRAAGEINQYFERVLGAEPDRQGGARSGRGDDPALPGAHRPLHQAAGGRRRPGRVDQRGARSRTPTARWSRRSSRRSLTSAARTEFYDKPWRATRSAWSGPATSRRYIEDNDGYQLFNRGGKPFSNEKELQLAFGLVWCGTEFDINREVNNGRGPVDFKVSFGAGDKSLIEFKLASNSQLKRNLEKQVAIYEAANRTRTSVKVIVIYTAAGPGKVEQHPARAQAGERGVDRAHRRPQRQQAVGVEGLSLRVSAARARP